MAKESHNPSDTVWAVVGAAGLTLAVFLLLPLSRMLSPNPEDERWTMRQVERVEIPPPPPPAPKPRKAAAAPAEASPDLRPPPPNPPLRSLPVALDARPDPDLFTAPAINTLAEGLDVGEEIRRFTFEDLQGGPRVLSVPPVSIPVGLARRGFGRGRVVFSIRILPDGSVEVLDVVESTHPELIEAARRSAARARFEPPEINGQRVAVEGNWPLIIESNRR